MIIVRLLGGLGNQMFQYATARRLAHVRKAELKIDVSSMGRDCYRSTLREYELDHLNITADVASPTDIAQLAKIEKTSVGKAIVRIGRKIGLTRQHPNIYRERHFHFDSKLLGAPDNIYLDGYWQSEKYFKDVENIIRKEFDVKYPLKGENLLLAEKIKNTISVSVHVRRGDYVSNSFVSHYHGTCGIDYYRKCVDVICARVSEPHFFLFSDEPEWAEKNLNLEYPITVVKHNGPQKGYEDMRLMSLCRHNIIANSSFSWWGAWLNASLDKMILAPEKWFRSPKINTDDLLPDGWTKVSTR